ncbi:AMP-binding protein [Nocardioidaceae bacterium]|nr:AMP-binding protein [Nocardioidaceae bacterium]
MSKISETVKVQVNTLVSLGRAGVVRPYGPKTLAGLAKVLTQHGVGFAGGFGSMALRGSDETAVIDELGSLTWGEIDERTTRLANGLLRHGVHEGDSVAVLCRNHRGFIDISVALAKIGADILYLNTAFAAPQMGEVCAREKPVAIVYDEEFTQLVDDSGVEVKRVVAWVDSAADDLDIPTLEGLIQNGSTDAVPVPQHTTAPVILTSGTTGTPKGAPRSEAGMDAAGAILSKIPLKYGWTCHIAAPLFHTWGWAHLNLAMLLGTTMVLTRKFDPEHCMELVEQHECDSLVVIPVMLQRMMRLDDAVLDKHPMKSLEAVCASGSALPGDFAMAWMDRFGDNLYNIYGSTEVAWATIAQPSDLRTAPGTAGKPPYNTVVKLFDESENEVPQGEVGRIFVGNSMLFAGYTGGTEESKEVIDGLMSSGDLGRFDEHGLLHIEGRDDEMIVSGGENVFPKEVEDTLSRHDAVDDVACIGVDDEEFGKRLRAFVVRKGEVDEDTLKKHVKDNLARYKVPRDFVFMDELPRNATGKILKKDLKDLDENGEQKEEASA